ncbi:hypothetical protein CDD82_7871 [Ophiocordyceps australis]|uniref:RRM domain-containing protein n=1 Tax=Ophiocordyceps australis TaxID=1399860 RepID=A0A2C5YNF7_9HYPO|nr:hypothetical protein CDD82_7871 [Ophiocordyceps australis]
MAPPHASPVALGPSRSIPNIQLPIHRLETPRSQTDFDHGRLDHGRLDHGDSPSTRSSEASEASAASSAPMPSRFTPSPHCNALLPVDQRGMDAAARDVPFAAASNPPFKPLLENELLAASLRQNWALSTCPYGSRCLEAGVCLYQCPAGLDAAPWPASYPCRSLVPLLPSGLMPATPAWGAQGHQPMPTTMSTSGTQVEKTSSAQNPACVSQPNRTSCHCFQPCQSHTTHSSVAQPPLANPYLPGHGRQVVDVKPEAMFTPLPPWVDDASLNMPPASPIMAAGPTATSSKSDIGVLPHPRLESIRRKPVPISAPQTKLSEENIEHQDTQDLVFDTYQLSQTLPAGSESTSPCLQTLQHPTRSQRHSIGGNSAGGFLPMLAVSAPEKRRHSLSLSQLLHQQQQELDGDGTRFSIRYHGMHTESNASADHLAPEQNCALWLTNLPADVSYSELLGSIRHIGRVWCSYINLPDGVKHHTAAAKVVFFAPCAAQKLLTQAWTSSIVIRGHRVRVSHNRIKSDRNDVAGPASRVLIITGSAEFVDAHNLRLWFSQRFIFQEDDARMLISAPHRAVCEFRFGSYRCQSQMGKMALEKDRPEGFEKVEFGQDPCEVGDSLVSYGIAADRIQGKGL